MTIAEPRILVSCLGPSRLTDRAIFSLAEARRPGDWATCMRYLALALASVAFAAFAGYGCGSPKMPTGPAPEYEDPPAPSWLEDAGTDASAPDLS
jgi:hypothetical protein